MFWAWAIISVVTLIIIHPIQNFIINALSIDFREDERELVFISSMFWFISVPWKSFVILLSFFEFFKDYISFRSILKNQTTEEIAKRYKSIVDEHKYLSCKYQQVFPEKSGGNKLPEDESDKFKKEIVSETYSFSLKRFIGRNEELIPLKKEARNAEDLKRENEKENERKIQTKFEDLTK